MKINEIFYTVQGEGLNMGRAALFIRLPFCNLSCPWCDTQFDTFFEMPTVDLKKLLAECGCRFAVITGGEPSMNKDCPELIGLLKQAGFEIAMETNGQFPVPAGIDHLTVSPKRWMTKSGKPGAHEAFWFDPNNSPSEIKVVYDSEMSDSVLDSIYARYERNEFQFKDKNPRFYLSPEWNVRGSTAPKVVSYVQKNPAWRVSIQSHKVLEVR
ncbi:MAG: 7-carboxy-7-deazaguanine synthase QueE [Deltaproteobacteria bacterium]|nr:7-carboxy-7-deazaguanine synthase QueE [Deltaproteobacteria bacterium]MBI3293428.1 7-carboxy-7-deazaguanine synthase QueE [Deltaproteobacteria bacterium]